MADTTKISIRVGELEFSGEGQQAWLEKQLDKILSKVDVANNERPKTPKHSTSEGGGRPTRITKTLASFLGEKNAKTVQARKFLATAAYLQVNGQNRLKTGDVTKALSDANQKRLGNPSDILNQNVGRGFCEKEGKEFYVTEEGLEELGL